MKEYRVIGLMSGTSLDGMDIAYCHIFSNLGEWRFKLGPTANIPYGDELYQNLKNAIQLDGEHLIGLHHHYGNWVGEKVKEFIAEHYLEVDFIASHGHTSHHRPEKGYTFQLGHGQNIANASRHKVICDLRAIDVSCRGQGAPIVPIGDRLFFSDYDFCLNLGGISNISFESDGKRIAYDIGLANMVLNHITNKNGIPFDKGGSFAQEGKINSKLLKQLNQLEYYARAYPKSTGYEWFVNDVMPLVDNCSDTMQNLLCTCVHHICQQIQIQVLRNTNKDRVTLLVTGGGALNNFMIATLGEYLAPKVNLHVPEKNIIEYKEALVMALMACLQQEREINVLASVTGARCDSCNGYTFCPL